MDDRDLHILIGKLEASSEQRAETEKSILAALESLNNRVGEISVKLDVLAEKAPTYDSTVKEFQTLKQRALGVILAMPLLGGVAGAKIAKWIGITS